jgi:N4-gp56 family major capsid protein
MKWRRYNSLATTGTRLTEGVTPAGKKLTTTDITAQLYQDGRLCFA